MQIYVNKMAAGGAFGKEIRGEVENVDSESEEERLQQIERLKASIHLVVGKTCDEIGAERGITFSKPVIEAIAQMALKQTQMFAKDLEQFAKHAKRSTVNEDDVKLLVRRNEKLLDHLNEMSKENEKKKKISKQKRKKTDENDEEGEKGEQPTKMDGT